MVIGQLRVVRVEQMEDRRVEGVDLGFVLFGLIGVIKGIGLR